MSENNLNTDKEKTEKQDEIKKGEKKQFVIENSDVKSDSNSAETEQQENREQDNDNSSDTTTNVTRDADKVQSETPETSSTESETEKIVSEPVSENNEEKTENSKVEQTISTDGSGDHFMIGKVDKLIISPTASAKEIYDNSPIGKIKEEIEEEAFIDPTEPFPEKPDNLPEFSSDELKQHIDNFEKKHILVIDCYNEELLNAATYRILGNITLHNCQTRKLVFIGDKYDRDDLDIFSLSRHKFSDDQATIIVINAVNKKATKFLDSLFQIQGIQEAESITRSLVANNNYFICLIDTQLLSNREYKETCFPSLHIEFLSHLLKHYFQEKALELERVIIEQRKQKKWASNDDKFYREIEPYLKNYSLPEEIKKRDNEETNVSYQAGYIEFIDNAFKENDYIKKNIIYIAAYFPELVPKDFNYLMFAMLDERKKMITETEKIIEDGHEKIVEKKVESVLSEIWEDNQNRLLQECGLHSVQAENGGRFLEFKIPNLRDEVQSHLENNYSLFVDTQFNNVIELGLLFHSSNKISENVIQQSINMAQQYPEHYGKDWLKLIIRSLGNILKQQIIPETEFDQFLQYLIGQENAAIKKEFYSRVSELIREMLNYSNLHNTVKSFLEDLMTNPLLHESVLEIVRRLRFSQNFDHYFWLNQLINRGNPHVKERTYIYLHQIAKSLGPRIYELLAVLHSWLPDPEKESNLSESNLYALWFIIDYGLGTLSNFYSKSDGGWPPKYALFANIEKKLFEEDMTLVINWIFHKDMGKVFLRMGINYENMSIIIGAFITDFLMVLYGNAETNYNENADIATDIIIKEMAKTLNKDQYKSLTNYWYNLCDSLVESAKIESLQNQKQIKNRYKIIRKIQRKFRDYRKSI